MSLRAALDALLHLPASGQLLDDRPVRSLIELAAQPRREDEQLQ